MYMRTFCTDYMYQGKWTEDFLKRSAEDYYIDYVPGIKSFEQALILPQKEAEGHTWGIGGALYPDGSMIEESQIGGVFGGAYPFQADELVECPYPVYYIPIIPKHWGHFLLDVLSRFWFVTDGTDQGYPIVFCGKDFEEHRITGNYLEALNALGIDESRMVFVENPMRFERILIPQASYGDGRPFCDAYLKTIRKLKENVLDSAAAEELKPYEKIYFTRTQFRRAHMTEVGEKEIEELFRDNEFQVLAPEKLSFTEQVFYFSTAKEIASLSGTISHNIMFCGEGTEVAVLNRCCLPNQAQFSVNQMSKAKVTYVDCYAKETLKKPQYWPVWVEINDNLLRYMEHKGCIKAWPLITTVFSLFKIGLFKICAIVPIKLNPEFNVSSVSESNVMIYFIFGILPFSMVLVLNGFSIFPNKYSLN